MSLLLSPAGHVRADPGHSGQQACPRLPPHVSRVTLRIGAAAGPPDAGGPAGDAEMTSRRMATQPRRRLLKATLRSAMAKPARAEATRIRFTAEKTSDAVPKVRGAARCSMTRAPNATPWSKPASSSKKRRGHGQRRSAGSGQRRHQGGRLSLKLIVRHHPADQTGSPGFLCAWQMPRDTRSRATFSPTWRRRKWRCRRHRRRERRRRHLEYGDGEAGA